MKRLLKYLYLLPAAMLLFAACEEVDQIKMVPYDQIVAPTLNAPADGTVVPLSKETEGDTAMVLRYSKTTYGVPLGTTYQFFIDVKDGDFTSNISLGTSTADTFAIMQGDLNDKLLEIGLAAGAEGAFDIMISSVATQSDSIPMQKGNVMSYMATPYASVFPPIYMIGAAVGGWDPALAVELAPTEEPSVNYTIAYFDATNGANFRFFNQPDWGASLGGYDVFPNYPTDLLEEAAGDSDPNFNFIGTAGWYEITTNQSSGTIEMSATTEPVLYLVGDATHGWHFDEGATVLKWVGHQIWEGDVTFTQNNYFRLFEGPGWGEVNYGYNIIAKYDTNLIIVADGHSDPNWQFVGASGTYTVRIDKRQETITITAK